MLRRKTRISQFVAILFISSVLAACGGGTSTSVDPVDTAPPVNNPPPANNPPPGGNNPPPAPVTRNIDLSWTAPAARTDGSAASLSDIGGYKLYVGTESGFYNPAIDVGNTTSHTLSSMSAGTYYLAMSAYDTSALESAKSGEFTVVVN